MATLIHVEPHPLAGQKVTLVTKSIALMARSTRYDLNGSLYVVQDWADRLRIDWQNATTPLATIYTFRALMHKLPLDDGVVAGWVGIERFLAHVTELRYDGDLLDDLDVSSF